MSRSIEVLLAELEENGDEIADIPVMQATFRKIIKRRCQISIFFPELDKYYKCRTISVEDSCITLDLLAPFDGNKALREGKHAILLTNLDGVCICIPKLENIQVDKDEDEEFYRLPYPSALHHLQRRNAYRAQIRSNEPIPVKVAQPDGILTGQMIDLSASGCCCAINPGSIDLPAAGEQLEQLIFTVPDGEELTCPAEVCHIFHDSEKGCTFFGLKFGTLSGMAERQIAFYVNKLQREERLGT